MSWLPRIKIRENRKSGGNAQDAIEAKPDDILIPSSRRLGSCITHRPDIVWIDSDSTREAILAKIREYPGYHHFPVCSGTIDSVIGVLPVRDFLDSLLMAEWPALKTLVRKPLYLPETVSIRKALLLLQESRCRMAFIIDEYGGIEGLVTRNGLISELIEETSADLTASDPEIHERSDGSYLIGGQVRMEEVSSVIDLPPTAREGHEYYTLAGYILSLNGSIPKTGDIIESGAWRCEIVDMDGHRIDKVLISKIPGFDGEEDVPE
ncbi:CBS domain-containing protein [Treponema zuelzerae]|uniref:CBS domain-containing protein n=1 Tax=Teretinema zuelzerae TaxID=156 RepID=A0AAE3JJ43_9SPIR|nr:transporter associated domain-containing protein [Teretinema zuelzerae]MBN2810447.1 CBS domain-containing protein [Spirochaetales bacterium]MCD1654971.1 CBS domain-containing protein [Teretinema zuelzerae]HPO03040.1 transporter associated domain-containing protein [Treponemataceae bacterium]